MFSFNKEFGVDLKIRNENDVSSYISTQKRGNAEHEDFPIQQDAFCVWWKQTDIQPKRENQKKKSLIPPSLAWTAQRIQCLSGFEVKWYVLDVEDAGMVGHQEHFCQLWIIKHAILLEKKNLSCLVTLKQSNLLNVPAAQSELNNHPG